MIKISDIYADVCLDVVNVAENGDLSHAQFNRMSKRAQLKIHDFLTGDVNNQAPPQPYTTQKIKDWLQPFIVPVALNIQDGQVVFTRPKDFYLFEAMVVKNSTLQADCETGKQYTDDAPDTAIELLDAQAYNERLSSYVERLRPSIAKPIAKVLQNGYAFAPADLGTIMLSYVRYPAFAQIVSMPDPVYNQQVVNEIASTNYEYDESMRELLVYYIAMEFGVKTREAALMQAAQANGKLARDSK